MKAKLINEAYRYQGSFSWYEIKKELEEYHGWHSDGNKVSKGYANDDDEERLITIGPDPYDDEDIFVVISEENGELDSGSFNSEGLSSGEIDIEVWSAVDTNI